MVDTVYSVFQQFVSFQTLIAQTEEAPDHIVGEAQRLFDAFQETEAEHVQRGLSEASFAFADAQDELREARLRFAGTLESLQTQLPLTDRARKTLHRIDALARRAPMTSVADLEVIRVGRDARSAE